MIDEQMPGQDPHAMFTIRPGIPWGEGEFQRLLDQLPAGAYMCDPEGLITYHNQRAIDMWGRIPRLNDPADRFCGSFKLLTSNGMPLQHDECWMALALRHNTAFSGCEIVVERPDGGRLKVLAHANPIYDESGFLAGAINVLVDITDRNRAEDALRNADRQEDAFLAMLAHELRNPLASITLASHILYQNPPDDPRLDQLYRIIHTQAEHLTRLMDDLLDVSRITCGKIDLDKRDVELAALIRDTVAAIRPIAEARQLQLGISAPDAALGEASLWVEGDRSRLAQVITNILRNAVKYTPAGGQIQVSVASEASDAMIRVYDTGVGIAPELLPRIFDLFTQAQSSPHPDDPGMGIGLALTKQLVEMHGGRISAHSEGLGAGSEFVVRLPLCEPPDTQPGSFVSALTSHTPGSKSILLVEDREDIAQTMAELLRLWGFTTSVACDGFTALEMLPDVRPDIAILDIGLPGMDGFELARRIRQDANLKEGLILIAVTGYGQDADKIRAAESGFDYHLVKPVDLDELREILLSASDRN